MESPFLGLLLGYRKILLALGGIISERAHFRRKKFSVSIDAAALVRIRHVVHMADDLGHQGIILFFRILLVQDAIRLIAQTYTAKQVMSIAAIDRIPGIRDYANTGREKYFCHIYSRLNRLVTKLGGLS